MPSSFPGTNDVFTEPSAPENTVLSSAGTGTRNHAEHHRDLGDAIEAIEANVPLLGHDHSGSGPRATGKLKQANTHQEADTDTAPTALHHTLGSGPNQAAPGNHKHPASDIIGQPMLIVTSTTRPTSPWLGLMIYETDTNRVRVWAKFPGDANPRWVLLPVASRPVVRVLQGTAQRIYPAGTQIEFRTEEEDTFGFFNAATSMTEIVITEPGLYTVDASVAWNNTDLLSDWAMSIITINGVETTRRHQEYIRGRIFNPGYVQDVPVSATLRLNAGDRLGLKASHNGSSWQWSYSSTSTKHDTRMDVVYISP